MNQCKFSKCSRLTPKKYPVIVPNHFPVIPDRFEIAIIMEYNDPSTPSRHPSATITSNGISIKVPKNDSATPSNSTIQKYGKMSNTTNN